MVSKDALLNCQLESYVSTERHSIAVLQWNPVNMTTFGPRKCGHYNKIVKLRK